MPSYIGCLPSQGSKGTVREFTYSLEKSGKVREFSDKSGKSQGISVKLGNLFAENSKWNKKYHNFDKFQKFLILRGQISGKKN